MAAADSAISWEGRSAVAVAVVAASAAVVSATSSVARSAGRREDAVPVVVGAVV